MRKRVWLSLLTSTVLSLSLTPLWAQNTDAGAPDTPRTQEIQQLRQMLAAQQAQIDKLQLTINQLQSGSRPEPVRQPASLGEVASTTPMIPASRANSEATTEFSIPAPKSNPQDQPETSPLQFHIGSAYITPVGFMDFTSEWRSTDAGGGIGTNFSSIPYGATSYQANMHDFRLSVQNSRIGFRVDANVHGAHVIGYMESDFLGNNPGNVAVSSNSNTLRSRLYWVDVRKNSWEVLGGQTWSLITPNRVGLSPLPGDLFFTNNIDVNYQLGLVWGRIPELRVAFHPSDNVAFAVALDSPEQYVGGSAGGPVITAPAALSSTYVGGELNNGTTTVNTPTVAPDVILKVAFDPSKKFHLELGGVARQFETFNPATATHFNAGGGGGFFNANFELAKGFRVLTNNYWSDGGGRYIFGQAPDMVVRADGSPSLVHSGSTVDGFEFTHKNTLLYAYYGGLYVGRDSVLDTNGKPVGYGYVGSSSGQNRTVQEGTFGLNETLWKDAKFGAINLMGQYSYLTRAPWYVATGQPSNAHLNMFFLNLRYTLPGSAPAMK